MFLNLDDVTADMVTASDVKDRMGRVLVPKGTVLSETQLKGMRMWGVPGVDVEGEEVVGTNLSPTSEISEERRLEMERVFAHNDRKHPAIQALFDVSLFKRL